jgi:hypothetical protein
MSQEEPRGLQLERDAAASARNAKPIVERAAPGLLSPVDAHWQAIAREMFEQGHEERAVMEALRRQGCRVFAAADAVKATRASYRNVHHMKHRKAGLKALATGGAMWVGAAAIVLACAYGGVVGRALIELVWGLGVGGMVPVFFGLYKLLTGSSVPLTLPEDRR